jgi:hemerythrin-like domain-containing protein
MPVQIGARAESDFTDPVGMLRDCHRRIERFLGVLRTIGDESDGGPLSAERRKALGTSLRYFREGAPRHVQDEEVSLFPRLRHQKSADVAAALAVVERLERDHHTVEAWHRELDGLGTRWSREGALDAASISRFRQLAQQLSELYDEHIQVEDNQVFPLAASSLPRSDLTAIGREMAERRGASVPAALASSAIEPLGAAEPHDDQLAGERNAKNRT